jgi:hypothetical protein
VDFWATAECAARRQSSARQRAPARAIAAGGVGARAGGVCSAPLCSVSVSVSVADDGSGTGGEGDDK